MPAFVEFLLVAAIIYLSESVLWLPLRGVALRKLHHGRCKVLRPGHLLATRRAGLVAMRPVPPDRGLAPCQVPPLTTDGRGGLLVETDDESFTAIPNPRWEDFSVEDKGLRIHGIRIGLSSPRALAPLKRARARGLTPREAVERVWNLALSPARADREWRRWRLVSAPLRWLCPLLTGGFFLGLPLVYVHVGPLSALWFALGLWGLMLAIGSHVWWLGRRVYPCAGGGLRLDAMLCALVPFHAMRIAEQISVHAMATTHPAAFILASGDVGNPWLARFARGILHPRPDAPGDEARADALRKPANRALARLGLSLAIFDVRPTPDDPGADRYCPRCHGLFHAGTGHCRDCRGVGLRPLA